MSITISMGRFLAHCVCCMCVIYYWSYLFLGLRALQDLTLPCLSLDSTLLSPPHTHLHQLTLPGTGLTPSHTLTCAVSSNRIACHYPLEMMSLNFICQYRLNKYVFISWFFFIPFKVLSLQSYKEMILGHLFFMAFKYDWDMRIIFWGKWTIPGDKQKSVKQSP